MKSIFFMAGLFWAVTAQAQLKVCFANSCKPGFLTMMVSNPNGISWPGLFEDIPNTPCFLNNTFQINSPKNVRFTGTGAGDVTAADAERLAKHISGVQPFTAPAEWIAADINGNSIIDSTDLNELNKFIDGTYTSFPNNWFWVFYPDTLTFTSPANPLSQSLPLFFRLFPADTIEVNAVAVAIGDVDMSGCAVSSTSTQIPANHVQVFPNPVNEVLHITTGSNKNDLQILLYDQLGRCVYSGLSGSATTSIPVSNYTPGLYFLQVFQNEQIIHNQTIVIQN